jgi:hypothetical protein
MQRRAKMELLKAMQTTAMQPRLLLLPLLPLLTALVRLRSVQWRT